VKRRLLYRMGGVKSTRRLPNLAVKIYQKRIYGLARARSRVPALRGLTDRSRIVPRCQAQQRYREDPEENRKVSNPKPFPK
jgi:hypothetical protein